MNKMTNNLESPLIKYQKQSSQVISLELLDPYTCIITNIPVKLSDNIIYTHELVPSFRHRGFAAKLKMLNSLKRCFQEMNLVLIELPNLSFKMFKNITAAYSNLNIKRSESISISRIKKLRKNPSQLGIPKCASIYKSGLSPTQKHSILHIGRWILTPHQRRTIEYFIKAGRRIIIGDDWNMGKTVTSLGCMYYGKCKKILVVVPKILLYHWLWHINQLKTSLSKQSTKRQKNEQFFVQVLDLQLIRCSMNEQKQEGVRMKSDKIKLKKQEININSCTFYSLCSYEHLNTQSANIKFDNYTGLILDEPQIEKAERIHKQDISLSMLRSLRKIQNIIILKGVRINQTRSLLPILNMKVDWPEVTDRYGLDDDPNANQNQYINAVSRSYYHSSETSHVQCPGNLIKSVLIPLRQNYPHDGYSQYQIQNLMSQKLYSVVEYIERMARMPSNNDQLLLIANNEILRQEMIKILSQHSLTIREVSNKSKQSFRDKDFMFQEEKKKSIKVGSLSEIIEYIEKRGERKITKQKKKRRAIICDLMYNASDMLYKLQKYSKIQYLECCSRGKDYQMCRIEQMLRNNLGNEAKIDKNAYINRILIEGEYISSDESAGHHTEINPQRYHDNQQESQMVDESQQCKDSMKIMDIQNIKLENQINQLQIECQQIKIPDNLVSSYKSHPKSNNIVEICLDSSFSRQCQSNILPKLESNKQLTPNISNQNKLMDIQIPQQPKHTICEEEKVLQDPLPVIQSKRPKRSTRKQVNYSNEKSNSKRKSAKNIKTMLNQVQQKVNVLQHPQKRMSTRKMKKQCQNVKRAEELEDIIEQNDRSILSKTEEKKKRINKKENKRKKASEFEKKEEKEQENQKYEQKQRKQSVVNNSPIQIMSDSGDISNTRLSYTPQYKEVKMPKNKSKNVLSVKLIPEYSQMIKYNTSSMS